MYELDQNQVAMGFKTWKGSIPFHQIAVFVMCGGGQLGLFAAEQPSAFYIDDRVGDLPYPNKQIYQAVETLSTLAEKNGLNPNKMPSMNRIHSCGIF